MQRHRSIRFRIDYTICLFGMSVLPDTAHCDTTRDHRSAAGRAAQRSAGDGTPPARRAEPEAAAAPGPRPARGGAGRAGRAAGAVVLGSGGGLSCQVSGLVRQSMLGRVRCTSEARNRKLIDATRYCIAQDPLSIVCTSYDAILAR